MYEFSFFVGIASIIIIFFFFNDPAATEIYTLSLHDALPILECEQTGAHVTLMDGLITDCGAEVGYQTDRKSTRLNSSHRCTSYAVFCLKKKIRVIQSFRRMNTKYKTRF